MLNFRELLDLRDKLLHDEIGIEEAMQQLWGNKKEGQRSWHTKDWKERRADFIKDKCQICNSNEKLTLQHLVHPRKYVDFLRELTNTYTKDYINTSADIDKAEFMDFIQNFYTYEPTALCPNCNARKPNKRIRKDPPYLCINCRHEFAEPKYITFNELLAGFFANQDGIEIRDKCFHLKQNHRIKQSLSEIKYWLQREKTKVEFKHTLEKIAFLNYLNDNIKYLSFEGTITTCGKCAYHYDICNMELCPKCRVNYKGIKYPSCIPCLPEAKRKVALEKLEIYNNLSEIHKKMGID